MLFFIALLLTYYVIKNQWSKPLSPILIIETPNNNLSSDKKEKSQINIPLNSNPNDWINDDWKKLGFSKKQVDVIINYRNKLGGFKNKKQLFNCFVFNEKNKKMLDTIVEFPTKSFSKNDSHNFFLILKSDKANYDLVNTFDTVYCNKNHDLGYKYYLVYNQDNIEAFKSSIWAKNSEIAKHSISKSKVFPIFKKKDIQKPIAIHINSADSSNWVKVRGIGPKRAQRIVSFRNKLGGFINTDQLREVYSISDSLYFTFKENLFLEDSSWNQININQIQSEFLVKHPYFNWNLANAIVNFRTQHGPFESKDKIKEIHLVNDKIYRKIAPYLKVN